MNKLFGALNQEQFQFNQHFYPTTNTTYYPKNMIYINKILLFIIVLAIPGYLCQADLQLNNIVGVKIEQIKSNPTQLFNNKQINAMTFEAFAKRLLENPQSLLQIKNIYIIKWPKESPVKSKNQLIPIPPPNLPLKPSIKAPENREIITPIKTEQNPLKPLQNNSGLKQKSIIITNNKNQVTNKITVQYNLQKTKETESKNSNLAAPNKPLINSTNLQKTAIINNKVQKDFQPKSTTNLQTQSISSTIIKDGIRKQPPLSAPLSELRDYMIYLTNELRKQYGVSKLTQNSLLNKIAQDHSNDMVRRKFFAHQNPDGQKVGDRAKRNNYFGMIGQNLAQCFSLDQGQEAFKKSQNHFLNAINGTWDQIGVGIALDGNKILITVLFTPENIVMKKLTDDQVSNFRRNLSKMIQQQSPNLKTFDEKLSNIIQRWIDSNRDVSVMNFVVNQGKYKSPMTASTYTVDYSHDMIDRIKKNEYFKNDKSFFSRFGLGCRQNGQKLEIYVIYM